MDKETLSNYGWIVICVLVLAVMLALAGPFGTFVAGAVKSTTAGLFGVNQNALGAAGITIDDQAFANCEHTYENYVCTQCGHIQDHTCNYENYKCTICGDIADHTCTYDSNNLCTICGEEKVIEYAFKASDYDSKFGTTTASDANVVIPETFEYNGVKYKVTNIGHNAFYNGEHNYTLKTVTLPNSLTTIGSQAFFDCQSLTTVNIPANVTSLGPSAFYNCISVNDITIPDNVESIGGQAFYNCLSLTSITIPSKVTIIDYRAFWDCKSLTSITFNGTIEQWNAITFGEKWNLNVPATYVQCSDGQVPLS